MEQSQLLKKYKEIKKQFKKIGGRFFISTNDNKHFYPHCHIIFADYSVVIKTADFSILEGKLPKNKKQKTLQILANFKDYLIPLFYLYNPNLKK